MPLQLYPLDQEAQRLVLEIRQKIQNPKDCNTVLNEVHKMRATAAYGLERFWGEHVRLLRNDPDKAEYWKSVWKSFVKIMKGGGITLYETVLDHANDDGAIDEASSFFWDETKLSKEQKRIALSVLAQFCDTLVWWKQRYMKDIKRGK